MLEFYVCTHTVRVLTFNKMNSYTTLWFLVFDGESQLFTRIVKFAIRVNIIKLLALKLLMENCRVAKMVKKILIQRNNLNFQSKRQRTF